MDAVLRGGQGVTNADSTNAGVFSTNLNNGPTSSDTWGGFRCAFSPSQTQRPHRADELHVRFHEKL